MAFQEVASLDAEVTISLGGVNRKTGKKNPTSVEGYYLGSRTVENKKGESKIHFFQTQKGNIGVWGKTDSDRKLAGIEPGTMTRISFDKMQATPNGEMYKYKVEVDSANTIDVAGLSASTLAGDGSISSFGDGEEGGYSSDEDTSDDDQNVLPGPIRTSSKRPSAFDLLSKKKA